MNLIAFKEQYRLKLDESAKEAAKLGAREAAQQVIKESYGSHTKYDAVSAFVKRTK